MPSIKKYQDKKILVEQLVEQGLTRKEISEQTDIPLASMTHYLKMWGLKTRNSWGKLSSYKEEVFQKFKEGYTNEQIAQEYDVAPNTVQVFLIRNGFKEYELGRHIQKAKQLEELLKQGKLLREIAKEINIPAGSLPYYIDTWGLREVQKQFRPNSLIKEEVKERLTNAVKKSHQSGNRPHHFEGLANLRGNWVSILEVKEELEYFIAQDIFIREMAEFMQVDPRTVTKWLKLFGLQQGQGRRGSRNKWWRGGHTRYRGGDWYSARQAALERDNHTCQICGITEEEYRQKSGGRGLSVHHKEPYYFDQQNLVDNLESLCQPCHIKLELEEGRFAGQVRTNRERYDNVCQETGV